MVRDAVGQELAPPLRRYGFECGTPLVEPHHAMFTVVRQDLAIAVLYSLRDGLCCFLERGSLDVVYARKPFHFGGVPSANIDVVLEQRGASWQEFNSREFRRRVDAWDEAAIRERVRWWASQLVARCQDLLRGDLDADPKIPWQSFGRREDS